MIDTSGANPSRDSGRPKAPAIVHFDRVEKTYGRNRVVWIERLVLQEGDRVMIYGANGSGKSTLLRLLAGISRPQKGSVWRARSLQDGILGYVPQSQGLYPELSVRANLEIRRSLYMQQDKKLEEKWYVLESGLFPILDKRFSDLSGGFQRLAAIAAALISRPTWLLFDEPFAGVDDLKRSNVLRGLDPILTDAQLVAISLPARHDFPQINKWIEMKEGEIACQEP